MPLLQPNTNSPRDTWLRRFSNHDPDGGGKLHPHRLDAIGNAAARETLVTATPHMSSIWTRLFRDILSPCSKLRWLDDGPGIGRDARIAYSSLLGRYLARAYLTVDEGVRVLVPLDEAQRRLKGTPYSILKNPARSRGLQADWVGLDNCGRLIIAEAKGSYDRGKRTWCGPKLRPQILNTAVGQAMRTVVVGKGRQVLPARRWAVASRWGTDVNKLEPTVLAWCDDDRPLDHRDYSELSRILFNADARAVLDGLGHKALAKELKLVQQPGERLPGDIRMRVRDVYFPPGFSALAVPDGFIPMRGPEDLELEFRSRFRKENPSVAIVSMASRYVFTSIRPFSIESEFNEIETGTDTINHGHAGLSVIWPREPTDIEIFPD